MPMGKPENTISANEFVESPYRDDSMSDLDETPDNTQNISSISVYAKMIGKLPLLKPEEEKAIFEKLKMEKTFLSEILLKLQHSNIDSEKQERVKQVLYLKRSCSKNGEMEFSLEKLNGLRNLIDDWKKDLTKENAFMDSCLETPDKLDNYFTVEPKEIAPGCKKDDVDNKLSQTLTEIITEIEAVLQRIEKIQQRLVKANLGLVISIAQKFAFYESSLSLLDLVQEGIIGFMKSIHKFRLEKGNKLSTYATWWINQAIRRALREQGQLIRLPSYIIDIRRRAAKMSSDLTQRLNREPRMDELAEAINITELELDNILQTPKDILSLDSPIGEPDSRATVTDLLEDDRAISPEEEVLSQARREIMAKLLSALTPQQAHVIKLRYGLFDDNDHTLAQIGEKLGVSRERVRQIESEALSKLRHSSRRHDWEKLLD